jgi:hypothetical protein
LRLYFPRLESLLPVYFANKWGAGGTELGKFMQAGQGWGHKITDAGDIRRLQRVFFKRASGHGKQTKPTNASRPRR